MTVEMSNNIFFVTQTVSAWQTIAVSSDQATPFTAWEQRYNSIQGLDPSVGSVVLANIHEATIAE